MATNFVSSFLELVLVILVCTIFLYFLYMALGKIKMPSDPSLLKNQGYSGGKEFEEEKGTFKTLFFQYAIYFLIFDTVAFIAALASFLPDWKLQPNQGLSQLSVHIIVYISVIAFLLVIIPKYKGDVN